MRARWWALLAAGLAVALFFGVWVTVGVGGVVVCAWWLDRQEPRPRARVARRRPNLARLNGPAWAYSCAYCGNPSSGWDHVLPFSRGGTEDRQNLVPACTACNSGKRDRTPEDWWREVGRGRPFPAHWPRADRSL